MKLRLIAAAVAALVLAGNAVAQDTSTEKGKLSYAMGYEQGLKLADLAAKGEQLDPAVIAKGLQDAMAKKPSVVTDEQLRPVFEAFQKRQLERGQKAKAEWDKLAADNKVKSDSFIAQNKAKTGVKSLPSGIQYRVIETGTGAKPVLASTVQLEVAGPFLLGMRSQPQAAPDKVPGIKISSVEMPAMREVLLQMPMGSKWEVTLPADKYLGADPRTGFPPNVAVQFEIKLVSVK